LSPRLRSYLTMNLPLGQGLHDSTVLGVRIRFLDTTNRAPVIPNGVKRLACVQVRSFASARPPAKEDRAGTRLNSYGLLLNPVIQ
jgi:hypothetical protein